MHWDGPAKFAAAAADCFTWTHGECCRYPRVDPLPLQLLLPIASLGPITFWQGACRFTGMGPLNLLQPLPIASSGAILFLKSALPMNWDGPAKFAAAAGDLFTWAHG
jgi:hypothetical protein